MYSGYAQEILLQPVDDTIFFAGEALHTGASQATVEAALASGKKVADTIKGINTYSAKSSP